jgi:hypothetical protein
MPTFYGAQLTTELGKIHCPCPNNLTTNYENIVNQHTTRSPYLHHLEVQHDSKQKMKYSPPVILREPLYSTTCHEIPHMTYIIRWPCPLLVFSNQEKGEAIGISSGKGRVTEVQATLIKA